MTYFVHIDPDSQSRETIRGEIVESGYLAGVQHHLIQAENDDMWAVKAAHINQGSVETLSPSFSRTPTVPETESGKYAEIAKAIKMYPHAEPAGAAVIQQQEERRRERLYKDDNRDWSLWNQGER